MHNGHPMGYVCNVVASYHFRPVAKHRFTTTPELPPPISAFTIRYSARAKENAGGV